MYTHTRTHTHIHTRIRNYFFIWGVDDWVGGNFLLLVLFRGVISRSIRRCFRCWRNDGVDTGICWDNCCCCCLRALDRSTIRLVFVTLLRGGLSDSVDVASARARLVAVDIGSWSWGWGSSFSISDVGPSLSDVDEGDEHDDESLSSIILRVGVIGSFVEFFPLWDTGGRGGNGGLRDATDDDGADGGTIIELVEVCERSESFGTRFFLPRPRKAVSISGEPGVVETAFVTCAGTALITVAFNWDESVSVDSLSVVSLSSSNPRNISIRFDNFLINNFKFDFRLLTVKYLLTFFDLRLKPLIIVQSSVVISIKFNVVINERIRSSLVDDFNCVSIVRAT